MSIPHPLPSRTRQVLDLCALPVVSVDVPNNQPNAYLGDRLRPPSYALLLVGGTEAQVSAKFRDFFNRGFITTSDWRTALLTPLGEQVRGSS